MEISLFQAISWSIDALIKRLIVIVLVASLVYLISQITPKLGRKYLDTPWTTKNVYQLLVLFLMVEYTLPLILGGIFCRDLTAFLSKTHPWRDDLAAVIFSCIIFSVVWYVVNHRTNHSFSNLGFSRYTLKRGLSWGLGSFFVFGILLFAGLKYFRKFDLSSDNEVCLLTILSTVAFMPIAEEIFFRGFVYPNFRQRTGVIFGMLLSTALFSTMHQLHQGWLSLFLDGLIFCWLYEMSGSLIPPIVAHASMNGNSILRSHLYGAYLVIIPWRVVWIVAIVTVVTYLLVLKFAPTLEHKIIPDTIKAEAPDKEKKIGIANIERWIATIILIVILLSIFFLGMFGKI